MKKIFLIFLCLLFISSLFLVVFQNRKIKELKKQVSFFENTFKLTYQDAIQGLKEYEKKLNKQEVTLNIYMKFGISEPKILAFKKSIEENTLVKDVEYLSKEEALLDFKNLHKGDFATIEAINEIKENPIPAQLIVTVNDSSKKELVLEYIKSNDKESIIENINSYNIPR